MDLPGKHLRVSFAQDREDEASQGRQYTDVFCLAYHSIKIKKKIRQATIHLLPDSCMSIQIPSLRNTHPEPSTMLGSRQGWGWAASLWGGRVLCGLQWPIPLFMCTCTIFNVTRHSKKMDICEPGWGPYLELNVPTPLTLDFPIS